MAISRPIHYAENQIQGSDDFKGLYSQLRDQLDRLHLAATGRDPKVQKYLNQIEEMIDDFNEKSQNYGYSEHSYVRQQIMRAQGILNTLGQAPSAQAGSEYVSGASQAQDRYDTGRDEISHESQEERGDMIAIQKNTQYLGSHDGFKVDKFLDQLGQKTGTDVTSSTPYDSVKIVEAIRKYQRDTMGLPASSQDGWVNPGYRGGVFDSVVGTQPSQQDVTQQPQEDDIPFPPPMDTSGTSPSEPEVQAEQVQWANVEYVTTQEDIQNGKEMLKIQIPGTNEWISPVDVTGYPEGEELVIDHPNAPGGSVKFRMPAPRTNTITQTNTPPSPASQLPTQTGDTAPSVTQAPSGAPTQFASSIPKPNLEQNDPGLLKEVTDNWPQISASSLETSWVAPSGRQYIKTGEGVYYKSITNTTKLWGKIDEDTRGFIIHNEQMNKASVKWASVNTEPLILSIESGVPFDAKGQPLTQSGNLWSYQNSEGGFHLLDADLNPVDIHGDTAPAGDKAFRSRTTHAGEETYEGIALHDSYDVDGGDVTGEWLLDGTCEWTLQTKNISDTIALFDQISHGPAREDMANEIVWSAVMNVPFEQVDPKYTEACMNTSKLHILDTLMRYFKKSGNNEKAKVYAQKYIAHEESVNDDNVDNLAFAHQLIEPETEPTTPEALSGDVSTYAKYREHLTTIAANPDKYFINPIGWMTPELQKWLNDTPLIAWTSANKSTDIGGKDWIMMEGPTYLDQFPERNDPAYNPRREIVFMLMKPDGKPDTQVQFAINIGELETNHSTMASVSTFLEEKAGRAQEYARSEKEDLGRATEIDFDKTKPTAYVGISSRPTEDGGVVEHGLIPPLSYLDDVMEEAGYDIDYRYTGTTDMSFADNPRDAQNIQTMRDLIIGKVKEAGDVNQVYLNLAGHGHREIGIVFHGSTGEVYLSPEVIVDILGDPALAGKKVILSTQACQGGGIHDTLLERMQEDPSYINDRDTSIITAAKEDELNQEARVDLTGQAVPGVLPDRPTIFSSYYDVFFQQALLAKKGLGEAHLIADAKAKQYVSGLNPEIIRVKGSDVHRTRGIGFDDSQVVVTAGPEVGVTKSATASTSRLQTIGLSS